MIIVTAEALTYIGFALIVLSVALLGRQVVIAMEDAYADSFRILEECNCNDGDTSFRRIDQLSETEVDQQLDSILREASVISRWQKLEGSDSNEYVPVAEDDPAPMSEEEEHRTQIEIFDLAERVSQLPRSGRSQLIHVVREFVDRNLQLLNDFKAASESPIESDAPLFAKVALNEYLASGTEQSEESRKGGAADPVAVSGKSSATKRPPKDHK